MRPSRRSTQFQQSRTRTPATGHSPATSPRPRQHRPLHRRRHRLSLCSLCGERPISDRCQPVPSRLGLAQIDQCCSLVSLACPLCLCPSSICLSIRISSRYYTTLCLSLSISSTVSFLLQCVPQPSLFLFRPQCRLCVIHYLVILIFIITVTVDTVVAMDTIAPWHNHQSYYYYHGNNHHGPHQSTRTMTSTWCTIIQY